MSGLALVNGRSGERLALDDRGLHYGDGLFETMRVRSGKIQLLERHLARLARGCGRLGIPTVPGLRAELADAAGQIGDGVLKLLLTRGSGERGYRPPEHPQPTRVVLGGAAPDYPDGHRRNGVVVRVCETRLAVNPALAGLKHLNRLEQVLARAEWRDPAVAEGLMLDVAGNLVGATAANLFLVHEGVLCTPRLDRAGVAGVMREEVIDAARLVGIRVRERQVKPDAFDRAQELMLTSSLIGIWPVREIAGRVLQVGPVTRRLQQALDARGIR